jgi:hypothetical protein
MSRRLRTLAFVAVVILSAAKSSADPIQITSGALDWRATGPAIEVTMAGEGFTFAGRTNRVEGIFGPIEQCGLPDCGAGTTVDLHSYFSGSALSGTATLDGTTYTRVGSLTGTSSVEARWTGSLVIPEGFTGGTLFAPFQFLGDFDYTTHPTLPWQSVGLFGSGTAAVTFSAWPNGLFPGALSLDAVTYNFEPAAATPEPASLLLLGTGLCGIAAARRRHKRSPRLAPGGKAA